MVEGCIRGSRELWISLGSRDGDTSPLAAQVQERRMHCSSYHVIFFRPRDLLVCVYRHGADPPKNR